MVLGAVDVGGQSGLSDIVQFFNTQSATGDVSGALDSSALAFKISMFVIMFVGGLAMAIWIGRIAVDIAALATRGFGGSAGAVDKIAKFGTGKSDSYESVGAYLKGNLLEIILMIVLIAFLMTGWLFRLIAIALDGFGTLGNKLLGLDIAGGLASLDAEAFTEQVQARRTASLRGEYDDQLSSARKYSSSLYDQAKDGAVSDDPQFNKTKSLYTQAMVKSEILATELNKRGAASELKLGSSYFKQHLRQNGDGVCNANFLVSDVMSTYSKKITCKK
ncbi:hypothetical protein [Bacillus subtilis]|uniref:hypothetical protein n=1 Tax=Bacillus subtilis TaxID=1423 RepID=UPI002025C354|nr:hypothetical protein [Bacillus subtilis]MCL9628333.1 hypothetical protein [Bacillus subtilis]